jgi:hypothetical protein
MAIAVNSSVAFNNSGASTTPSNTLNNVAGNCLVVGFIYDKNGTISLAQYNGVNMTHQQTVTMTGWVYKVSTYTLLSPATGSHTINFTISTSAQATLIGAVTYSGVNSVESSNSSYITSAGAQTQSVSTTVAGSGDWLVGVYNGADTGTTAGGTNTTIRIGGNQTGIVDSNGTVSSGSPALAINWASLTGGGEGGALSTVALKPPSTATISTLMMMGV